MEDSEKGELIKRIQSLEMACFDEQQKNKELIGKVKAKEQHYKEKLLSINKDLEFMNKRKDKSKEKLFQAFIEMRATCQNIQQICEKDL